MSVNKFGQHSEHQHRFLVKKHVIDELEKTYFLIKKSNQNLYNFHGARMSNIHPPLSGKDAVNLDYLYDKWLHIEDGKLDLQNAVLVNLKDIKFPPMVTQQLKAMLEQYKKDVIKMCDQRYQQKPAGKRG